MTPTSSHTHMHTCDGESAVGEYAAHVGGFVYPIKRRDDIDVPRTSFLHALRVVVCVAGCDVKMHFDAGLCERGDHMGIR